MARGDVVLVPFPFTDQTSIQVRPAVIVSTDQYTSETGDVLVTMITSQRHVLATDYALEDWASAGLLHPSWARAKLACLSQTLLRRTLGQASARDLAEIDTRLRLALGL